MANQPIVPVGRQRCVCKRVCRDVRCIFRDTGGQYETADCDRQPMQAWASNSKFDSSAASKTLGPPTSVGENPSTGQAPSIWERSPLAPTKVGGPGQRASCLGDRGGRQIWSCRAWATVPGCLHPPSKGAICWTGLTGRFDGGAHARSAGRFRLHDWIPTRLSTTRTSAATSILDETFRCKWASRQ
jgi:hypothetical protein